MYNKIAIILFLVSIFSIGLIVDRWNLFEPLKLELKRRTIPSHLLGSGETSEILRRLNLIHVVPNDYSQYIKNKQTKSDESDIRQRIFRRKRQIGTQLYSADALLINPEDMPSSTIIDDDELSNGVPLLSIAIDEDDLNDPVTGLLNNPLKKGRKWERPAYASYFVGEKLSFATGVGIRLHGRGSRLHSLKSFRLYFREAYGSDQIARSILFERGSEPLNRLVVQNDIRYNQGIGWHFVNPIAYDIARQIGCLVPQTKPVRLFLNGELQGVYVLTEYLSRKYLISHYGHDEFIFVKGIDIGPELSEDEREYLKFKTWAKKTRKPLTMEEVENRVDLDNLSRWFISSLFSGAKDPFQGPALMDKTKPNAKWFWIMWDLDNSFREDPYHRTGNAWEFDTFDHILNKKRDIKLRSVLLSRLISECPEYRDYLKNLLVEIMNHQLTQEFLNSRLNYYEKIAVTHGIKDTRFIQRIRRYFKYRPAILRKQMQTYLEAGESYPVRINGPQGTLFEIDGYPTKSGYLGWYFEGKPVKVKIMSSHNQSFSYWLINGKKASNTNEVLHYPVKSETTIEAIFLETDFPEKGEKVER